MPPPYLDPNPLAARLGKRFTSPNAVSWPVIATAKLVGIAKPIPTLPPDRERIAELIPIKRPSMSIKAPPELPGLMDASV